MTKRLSLALLSALAVSLPMAAVAQTVPATVTFGAAANMPSLTDNTKKDTFSVDIADGQVVTRLELTCSAGRTDLLIIRQDKACAVGGNGSIINPSNNQALPRTQYAGGYTVKSDGYTDGSGLTINYLALGKVAPSSASFTGSMNLRPETTSTGAQGLRDAVLRQLNATSGGSVIDDRVDTVDLNNLFIPSAGLPSDPGCSWSGNMIFAYQTDSWFMDLKANCGGKEYALKGNMPWTDSPGVENQTQYDLTLTLPSESVLGDDALFASSDANADLFSVADGVSAQIIMKESRRVTIKVDGVDTSTPSRVEASGSFTGTNVPVEVVRSLATLFGLLSSNLFGA